MILPRYQELKESGIDFLGNVPSNWSMKRLGDVVAFAQGKAHEPYIDDDGDYICVNSRFVSTEGRTTKNCTVNLTPASLNDILMVMSDLPNGRALARAYYVHDNRKYAVNQRVCRITAEKADSRFLFYLLDRHSDLIRHDDGVNQTHLSNDDFLKLKFYLPSFSEQTQIARFLDHEIARIDSLIEEQRRLIELLKEKSEAVISHAVTKGLNPAVTMKYSGVEWLGLVPAHWDLFPIKYLALLNPRKSSFGGSTEQLCSFVPMEKLKTGVLQLDEERPIEEVIGGYTYFEEGDVLQAKVTPCFENRNIAIAKALINGVGFGSSEINVLRPFNGVSSEYLYYRLQESIYMRFCIAGMIGAGGLKRVPTDVINSFKVAAPDLSEQIEIAQYLDREIMRINDLIQHSNGGVTILQERRSALISAAVTGKIDVRSWVPPANTPSIKPEVAEAV